MLRKNRNTANQIKHAFNMNQSSVCANNLAIFFIA